MISPNTIQQVRDIPITDVIGYYIKLKQHGTKATACCPFHSEKTPSFSVSSTKGIFKCFGCGAAGDSIAFVMKHKDIEFLVAIDSIAAIFGILIEHTQPADPVAYKEQQTRQQQQALAAQFCADLYHQQLLNLKPSHPVVQHLHQRGYCNHTIKKWHIGWCNAEWRQATERLVNDGLFEASKALGLVRTSDNGSHYDAYRSRIIFPIQNARGQHVGLGGRWFPTTEQDKGNTRAPKYLNSTSDADSIYQKSNTLYGLPQAIPAIKREGKVFLVEGYTDTISMHAFGDANTVGTCGTALTPQQAELIKRHTRHVILLRDGDNAGQKAASRDLTILLQQGLRVEHAEIPEKMDPDEYIKALRARA